MPGSPAHRPGEHDGVHPPALQCLPAAGPVRADPLAAVALLLVRSALSQMDVPTRNSYVMAVVPPGSARRRRASRRCRAASPGRQPAPRRLPARCIRFGWPLVIGGGLKIVYDSCCWRRFATCALPKKGHLGRHPDRAQTRSRSPIEGGGAEQRDGLHLTSIKVREPSANRRIGSREVKS